MRAAAWNSGVFYSTGAGYGLRLEPAGRDRSFDRVRGKYFRVA